MKNKKGNHLKKHTIFKNATIKKMPFFKTALKAKKKIL